MVLDLHAERTSTSWMASNQMRLWFSSLAYLLLERVRTLGLGGTQWANVALGTLRLRFLKVAALLEVSIRRVHAPRREPEGKGIHSAKANTAGF